MATATRRTTYPDGRVEVEIIQLPNEEVIIPKKEAKALGHKRKNKEKRKQARDPSQTTSKS
jgi:hypothetical protein